MMNKQKKVMKKIIKRISEGLEWVVFSKWYKGSDMGDGILVSIISGAFFIGGGVTLAIYIAYNLLYAL